MVRFNPKGADMALHYMTDLEPKTLGKVQELIRLNLASYKGFTDAAERIEDASAASLFRELSYERQRQAEELRQFVATRGDEEPADSGSAIGALRRAWMDMRAAINAGDPYVILIECERCEDKIKEHYQDLLDASHAAMNDPLHETLLRHYEQVRAAHDRVRVLRDAYKKK
jgi:uncharacterized protein (TIGR02284 family)